MNIDNQADYWNRVAQAKTFTLPLNLALFSKYIVPSDRVVDFGCGYGRLVQYLADQNYTNVSGFDTSIELIKRGHQNGILTISHINNMDALPLDDNSVDCFLLVAVLTCIPSNRAQEKLMQILHSKLKPGGVVYLSDFYLQDNKPEGREYTYLNEDPNNFGVFTLPDGATLRHHTREWIAELIRNFKIKESETVAVKTMNGNDARAFQFILQK